MPKTKGRKKSGTKRKPRSTKAKGKKKKTTKAVKDTAPKGYTAKRNAAVQEEMRRLRDGGDDVVMEELTAQQNFDMEPTHRRHVKEMSKEAPRRAPRRGSKAAVFAKSALKFALKNPKLTMAALGLGAAGAKELRARLKKNKKAYGTERVNDIPTRGISEYYTYFGKQHTLCSPMFHKDDQFYYDDARKKYYCAVDHGESGMDWNFIDATEGRRRGEANKKASEWWAKRHGVGYAPTRWVEMPDEWKPPKSMLGVTYGGRYDAGRPKVAANPKENYRMDYVTNIPGALPEQKFTVKMRRYVSDKAILDTVPVEHPCDPQMPFLYYEPGETLPNGQVLNKEDTGGEEGVFFCPMPVGDPKASIGDRFVQWHKRDSKRMFETTGKKGTFIWTRMKPGWTPALPAFGQESGMDTEEGFMTIPQEDGVARWQHPMMAQPENPWRYGPNYDPELNAVKDLPYICADERCDPHDNGRLYCDPYKTDENGCVLKGKPYNSIAMLTAKGTRPGDRYKGKVHNKK